MEDYSPLASSFLPDPQPPQSTSGENKEEPMNPRILQFKKVTAVSLIIFGLACLAPLPRAQAVNPPIRIGIAQTKTFIAGIRGVTTVNAAIPVLIDTVGQLGTMSSSARFKKEIKAMDSASEAILALKPVTFHYKSDKTNTPQFGLIAEEVAAVNPNLVVRDKDGEIYTVRYDAVNTMLLNEFLKEHRKNEEQEATIARQQKQIDALTAGLQKVSAQLELSKSAPKSVVDNQ
jgi:hypothetical protein